MCMYCLLTLLIFFELYGDHRDLHVLTHSFPTRRVSDLFAERRLDLPAVGDVEHGGEGVAVGEWHGGELEIPAVGERDAPAPLLAFDRGAAHQLPDRKNTRLTSSHSCAYRLPSSA